MRRLLWQGALAALAASVALVGGTSGYAKGPPSCADAKKVRLDKCSPVVVFDSMPGDVFNSPGGNGTSSGGNGGLVDNDVAAGFAVRLPQNVLLDSIDLPLSWFLGANQLDVYLVAEKARDAGVAEPYAPDDSVVLEQWYLEGISGGGVYTVYHLPSVQHPKLYSGVRYWVFISAHTPIAYIQWPTTSNYTGEGWFAERNFAYPDWITHSGHTKPMRVTGLQ
jgi:hypothetical protein